MMFLINTWYRMKQAGWRANLAFLLLFIIFVLNIVVLTAGGGAATIPSLEQVNMLTIDTHNAGQILVAQKPAETKAAAKSAPAPAPKPAPAPGPAKKTPRGIIDDAKKGVSKVVPDKAKEKVNAVTNGAKSAAGVQQWYSYHLLNSCSGSFSKDGKTKENVKCSKPEISKFSTDPIDGLNKGLKDAKLGDTLSKGIKEVGSWLGFVAWLYLGSLLCTVALMLFKFKSVLISPLGYHLVMIQQYLAAANTVMLIAASTGEIVFVKMLATIINVGGGLVGVKATVGQAFIQLTWVLTIMMGVVALLCFLEKRRFAKYGFGY